MGGKDAKKAVLIKRQQACEHPLSRNRPLISGPLSMDQPPSYTGLPSV